MLLAVGEMVDIERLRRLYVEEQWSTHQIADRVGMSSHQVWRMLTRAGVRMRQRGVQPRLSEDDLRRWYQDEGLSTIEIARRTGMSSSGVHAALVRAGVPRRPVGGPELAIDDQTLERLYVTERVDLEELAARFKVRPWAVRRRLREAGIIRPAGVPPGGDRPMPPRDELERQYADEQATLSDVAARYGVAAPTARRWLEAYGITVRPQPPGAGVRPTMPRTPSREELWELYVTQGLTTAEIAQRLGVSKKTVTTALHAQRIPVRPPGPSRRLPVVLLDALYGDPAVTAVLGRHGIERRPQAGSLRERWPVPAPLSEAALEDLYVTVGLSVDHISLLTGHEPSGIRHRLQQAGLSARSASRSPWHAAANPHW
jgi:excisionase family DNA binding protein